MQIEHCTSSLDARCKHTEKLLIVPEASLGGRAYSSTAGSGRPTSGLLPLADASQQPYVSELLSFTLDRLDKEPELLRVDAERIRRQMQEVAVGNYRAFIAASDALSVIREQLTGFDNHLVSLGHTIEGIDLATVKVMEAMAGVQRRCVTVDGVASATSARQATDRSDRIADPNTGDR